MINDREKCSLRFEGDREEVVWEVLYRARVLSAWHEYEIVNEDPYWILFEAQTIITQEAVYNGVQGQAYTHLIVQILDAGIVKEAIQNAVLALINDHKDDPVALEDIIQDGEYEPEATLLSAVEVLHAIEEAKVSTKH